MPEESKRTKRGYTERPYGCMPQGSRHHAAKITEEDVKLIRELDQERRALEAKVKGLSQSAIADKFNISKQRVWEICSGGGWSHVS